jgi:hypothetical protein
VEVDTPPGDTVKAIRYLEDSYSENHPLLRNASLRQRGLLLRIGCLLMQPETSARETWHPNTDPNAVSLGGWKKDGDARV